MKGSERRVLIRLILKSKPLASNVLECLVGQRCCAQEEDGVPAGRRQEVPEGVAVGRCDGVML